MLYFILLLVLSVIFSRSKLGASGSEYELREVRKALIEAEIITTVVDDFKPIYLLNVIWQDSEAESMYLRAALGNTLRPSQLQDAPSISICPSRDSDAIAGQDNGVLTSGHPNLIIAMTDPDAPSRKDPKWSEFCHWIARGVHLKSAELMRPLDESEQKALELRDVQMSNIAMDDIIDYKPPGPPEGTGKHRYVFLALSPSNGTHVPLNLTTPKDRPHWGNDEYSGVKQWATENGLKPIAANFIYAEH